MGVPDVGASTLIPRRDEATLETAEVHVTYLKLGDAYVRGLAYSPRAARYREALKGRFAATSVLDVRNDAARKNPQRPHAAKRSARRGDDGHSAHRHA